MPVSAVVAIASTVVSVSQQNKARKETRRANNRAARIEAIRAQRERTQALRQSRVQSANLLNQATVGGFAGASGVQGAQASLGSQTASNFQFTGAVDTLSAQRNALLGRAQSYQSNAQFASTIGSAATSIGDNYGI